MLAPTTLSDLRDGGVANVERIVTELRVVR
jgi:hypothetical protein